MDPTAVQSAKIAVVAALGLSKDALHIYVGLFVFLLTAVIFRRPLGSPAPWLAVLIVGGLGEAADAIADIRSVGHWVWPASMHDMVNTLFWPTALLLLARYRSRNSANSIE